MAFCLPILSHHPSQVSAKIRWKARLTGVQCQPEGSFVGDAECMHVFWTYRKQAQLYSINKKNVIVAAVSADRDFCEWSLSIFKNGPFSSSPPL